jgi:hypothetical protein
MNCDIQILRDLTSRYAELTQQPHQQERRRQWRKLNSLKPERPLIYVRAFAWQEMAESQCKCEDLFLRRFENYLRERLFHSTLGDDFIYEPWLSVEATYKSRGWGVEVPHQYSGVPGGSFKLDYPIREEEDFAKLRFPRHEIDEAATQREVERITAAVGDLITINVDRGPAYRMWAADLSSELGYLRGIENFMLDMMDRPEWLHRLLTFMRDGVLAAQEQAEKAGDWGLCDHQNQSMSYALELADPAANRRGVKRKELLDFHASQEFALVGPELWNEFMLEYQKPIMENFALSAYGCCEDLTEKIDMLRQIPNLRIIAVAPRANVRRCAQQIGQDYVMSWRPNPADVICCGFDESFIRRTIRENLSAARAGGCHVHINLKDVYTLQGDTTRLKRWVDVARAAADGF